MPLGIIDECISNGSAETYTVSLFIYNQDHWFPFITSFTEQSFLDITTKAFILLSLQSYCHSQFFIPLFISSLFVFNNHFIVFSMQIKTIFQYNKENRKYLSKTIMRFTINICKRKTLQTGKSRRSGDNGYCLMFIKQNWFVSPRHGDWAISSSIHRFLFRTGAAHGRTHRLLISASTGIPPDLNTAIRAVLNRSVANAIYRRTRTALTRTRTAPHHHGNQLLESRKHGSCGKPITPTGSADSRTVKKYPRCSRLETFPPAADREWRGLT